VIMISDGLGGQQTGLDKLHKLLYFTNDRLVGGCGGYSTNN